MAGTRCVQCKELVQAGARKCPHCGSNPNPPTAAEKVILGFSSVGCVVLLAVAGLIGLLFLIAIF